MFTEWSEFAEVDPKEVAAQMSNLSVFDGRNILDKILWKTAGFTYKGIGQ